MIKRFLLLAAVTLALLSGSALADMQQFLTGAIANYGGALLTLFGIVLITNVSSVTYTTRQTEHSSHKMNVPASVETFLAALPALSR